MAIPLSILLRRLTRRWPVLCLSGVGFALIGFALGWWHWPVASADPAADPSPNRNLTRDGGSELALAARGALSGSFQNQFETSAALSGASNRLADLQAQMAEFARTNRTVDLDREISLVQQQHSDTQLKLELLRTELQAAESRIKSLTDEAAQLNPTLAATRSALQDALSRYTEEHPKVRELRAAVARLEAESAAAATNAKAEREVAGANGLALSTNLALMNLHVQMIERRAAVEATRQQAVALEALCQRLSERLEALDGMRRYRDEMAAVYRQQEVAVAQLWRKWEEGVKSSEFRVQSSEFPANYAKDAKDLAGENGGNRGQRAEGRGQWAGSPHPGPLPEGEGRGKRGVLAGMGLGVIGGLGLLVGFYVYERRQPVIQSVRELEAATAVPTIARLRDLSDLNAKDRQRWALETFSVLKGRADGHGELDALVCGFTAADRRSGTSTCIKLLAEAARKQGYFTLVLDFSRRKGKQGGPRNTQKTRNGKDAWESKSVGQGVSGSAGNDWERRTEWGVGSEEWGVRSEEARDQKSEGGSQRSEVSEKGTDVRGQGAGSEANKVQSSEFRVQSSEFPAKYANDAKDFTGGNEENGGARVESRGQGTESPHPGPLPEGEGKVESRGQGTPAFTDSGVAVSEKPEGGSKPEAISNDTKVTSLQSENVLAKATEVNLPGNLVQLNSLGAVYDWSFRKQFSGALAKWNQSDNLVVLVDLPPYSTPEAVLLAEKLPNLVWCCRSGMTNLMETTGYMKTLKASRRNVIGAVFNEATPGPRRKARRWSWAWPWQRAALIAALGLNLGFTATPGVSQEANVPPLSTNLPLGSLSINTPTNMAPWQERLTLGSGDVLDISLYGVADTVRPGIVIGPDGRINYLQARDILAAGLTVDELRDALEKDLSRYHLAPKVVINPVAYNSKRYYILGNVVRKGTYLLDRPTTIIEAIAKGGGFVSAVQNQNAAMLVDLERSFLVRKQAAGRFDRVPVNFEALFQQGDLAQNIALAPEDYLFFPEAGRKEVYVLGEVRAPGLFPYSKEMTALGAIAGKGGFTDKAWKGKILVIRGSLQNPQTVVVDGGDILKGKGKDFQLQNRDIVYVHRKPWAKAQEILEYGIEGFLRAAITGWTGQHVGPWITEPIID